MTEDERLVERFKQNPFKWTKEEMDRIVVLADIGASVTSQPREIAEAISKISGCFHCGHRHPSDGMCI